MYTVPRFYSVWEKFISCLFRSLRSKKNISSEAFSPALHCTALYNYMFSNCGGVLQILIYSQDMHHTFLYVSLLKSLHYNNLRFVNFTVYGGREPQDNDFHFSFTQRESTPLESNRRKMRQHLRNWATRNNSNEVLKKSMNTVFGGRFFAPYSRLTLRRFWSRYCFYYHFAKKHKIYILNLKKNKRWGKGAQGSQ